MCGIVYAHSFDGSPVNNAVMQQFDKQRSRGVQGFGLFDGQEKHMVHAAKEDRILNWLCKYNSNLILFHHRFPTSTVNVKRAAHPFSTKEYFGDTQYILVHNGSVRNADELFVDHQELGIDYQSLLTDLTFNDSEALLWDFALTMEGQQDEMKAYGGIAFVCIKMVNGELDKLYFARNRNPLNMFRSKEGIALSSEGEGEPIDADTLYTWNYKLKRLTNKSMKVKEYKPYNGAGFHNNWNNSGAYTPGSRAAIGSGYQGNFDNYEDGDSFDSRYGDWRDDITEAGPVNSGWKNGLDERMGGRIGNVLSRQYGHKFKKPRTTEEKENVIFGYVKNDAGVWVPEEDVKTAPSLSRKTAEQELVVRKGLMPTADEVTSEYMQYLVSVAGHFEQAYWSLECDYEEALNAPDTLENIRKRTLIEKVMERIDSDDEYVNEESVSSIWRSIWQQQKLISEN